jgi:hypothetical protein
LESCATNTPARVGCLERACGLAVLRSPPAQKTAPSSVAQPPACRGTRTASPGRSASRPAARPWLQVRRGTRGHGRGRETAATEAARRASPQRRDRGATVSCSRAGVYSTPLPLRAGRSTESCYHDPFPVLSGRVSMSAPKDWQTPCCSRPDWFPLPSLSDGPFGHDSTPRCEEHHRKPVRAWFLGCRDAAKPLINRLAVLGQVFGRSGCAAHGGRSQAEPAFQGLPVGAAPRCGVLTRDGPAQGRPKDWQSSGCRSRRSGPRSFPEALANRRRAPPSSDQLRQVHQARAAIHQLPGSFRRGEGPSPPARRRGRALPPRERPPLRQRGPWICAGS